MQARMGYRNGVWQALEDYRGAHVLDASGRLAEIVELYYSTPQGVTMARLKRFNGDDAGSQSLQSLDILIRDAEESAPEQPAKPPLSRNEWLSLGPIARLIETALAVDGDAWVAAIDKARTRRPIDAACDVLARILGESPALWQEGLGYYPQNGARGLLARAFERAQRCRICGEQRASGTDGVCRWESCEDAASKEQV